MIIPTLTAASWPSAIRRMRFGLCDGRRGIRAGQGVGMLAVVDTGDRLLPAPRPSSLRQRERQQLGARGCPCCDYDELLSGPRLVGHRHGVRILPELGRPERGAGARV